MVLPDTIVYYCLLTILILIVHRWKYAEPKLLFLAWVYAIVFIVSFWSTIASLLPIMCLGIVLCIFFLKSTTDRKYWKSFSLPVIFTITGMLIFPLFYLAIGSFSDFWWSVFKFNTDYYFPLRLAQNNLDLKYGPLFQIVWQFWTLLFQSFLSIIVKTFVLVQSLWGIHRLVLSANFTAVPTYVAIILQEYMRFFESLQSLIFIGIGFTYLYLLQVRKLTIAVIFITLSMSMFFRSNELFHLSPLYLLVVLAASMAVVSSWRSGSRATIALPLTALFLLAFNQIPIYVHQFKLNTPYLYSNLYSTSEVIDANSLPTDKITVVGGNWIYYLLARRLPACKYHYYYPWLEKTPKIKSGFEDCLGLRKAKLVIGIDNDLVNDVKPILDQNYKMLPADQTVFIRSD
jgi:hypothetical protein